MNMDVRYPLLLGQAEDLLFERDICICHETVRVPHREELECYQPVRTSALGPKADLENRVRNVRLKPRADVALLASTRGIMLAFRFRGRLW